MGSLEACILARRKEKYTEKGPGCFDRGQLLLPLINAHNGSFQPTQFNHHDEYKNAASKLFDADDLGKKNPRPRSTEEALIRKWSRKVADVEEGGKGVYDSTLSIDAAAGIHVTHTHRRIAFFAIRSSANAAIHIIRKNNFRVFDIGNLVYCPLDDSLC